MQKVYTPLISAIKRQWFRIALLLIDCNTIDVNKRSQYNESALDKAREFVHPDKYLNPGLIDNLHQVIAKLQGKKHKKQA